MKSLGITFPGLPKELSSLPRIMPPSWLRRKNMSSFKSKLKLYSDENIPDKVIELLEKEGFDVKRAPFRSDDEEIAKEAKSDGRIILSFDRHLGNILLFPPEKYSGIVLIRIRPPL